MELLLKNFQEFSNAMEGLRQGVNQDENEGSIYIMFNKIKQQQQQTTLSFADFEDIPFEKHITFTCCELYSLPLIHTPLKSLGICLTSVVCLQNLGAYKDLETLTISDSNLVSVPDVLRSCKKLTYLKISGNKRLEHVPTWLNELPLEHLDLGSNNLLDVPELLSKTLCVLKIHNNQIKRLSPFLAQCDRLVSLCLHGNPLVFPELSIALKSKTVDLMAYLRAFLAQTIPNNSVKVSLVGQERVGKSTLLQALKSSTSLSDSAPIAKTDGLEISDVSLKGLNLRVFDLAGDIDFMETHTMFISERTLFLAVFDLQMFSLHSMPGLNSYAFGRLEVWLSSIYAQSPNSRVLLVGTHADGEMITPALLDSTWQTIKSILLSVQDAHLREFNSIQEHKCLLCSGKTELSGLTRHTTEGVAGFVISSKMHSSESCETDFAGKEKAGRVENEERREDENGVDEREDSLVFPHVVGYFEVSSTKQIPRKLFSSRNTSIDQLKEFIHSTALDMLSQNPSIPRKWVDLHQYLTKKAEKQFPIITYADLCELSRDCGFRQSEEDDLDPFLRHYNSCGELLYYPEIEELSDVIIIDPQWLSNQLRSVISFRSTHLICEGVVQHTTLDEVWSHIEPTFRTKVISLFRQAGVFIQLSESADLVPSRLPLGRPSEDSWAPDSENRENQVSYCFKFNNLPTAFFSHLASLVESRKEEFSVGKMAPVFYSNHIVYITQATGIACDLHSKSINNVLNLGHETERIASGAFLTRGIKLSQFLSLDSGSVQSLVECNRNSYRVSMTDFSGFNSDGAIIVDNYDEERIVARKSDIARHRIHFELLPHLNSITVTIRGPKPCCLAPETIDLLNRTRLVRYTAVHTAFSIFCSVCLKKGGPKPSKFTLTDVNDDEEAPICEKGHDLKSWANLLTGVCDYVPTLTARRLLTNLSEIECPKLFLMMPVNLHGVGFREFYTLSYLKEGYSIHLLCEYPDCWHFLTAPGYRLTRPKDFVKKYGRRLQTMLRVLSKLEIPARVAGFFFEGADSLADLLASMKQLADDLEVHLTDFTEERSTPASVSAKVGGSPTTKMAESRESFEDELRYLRSNEGLNRRELRKFLNKADEEGRFGDLIPTFVGEQLLWLCEQHARTETARIEFC